MRPLIVAVALLAGCHGHHGETSADDTSDTDATTSPYDDDLGGPCPVDGVALPPPPTPVASFPFLPTSNGWVSATYAIDAKDVPVTHTDGSTGTTDQSHAMVAFTDHLAQQPSAGTSTRDLLWDMYPGLRVDGAGTWTNTLAEDEVGYEPGTGIVRVVQHVGDVTITTSWFAPWQDEGERDLVGVYTVENTGAVAHDVSLYTLDNAHTGGEGHADGEGVSLRGSSVAEQRGSDVLLHTPLPVGSASGWAAAPGGDDRNPWMRLTNGQDLGDDLVSGNDVAVGFEWALGALSPGQSVTRGVVLSYGGDASELSDHVASFVGGRSADEVLDAERDAWSAWHGVETVRPSQLSDDELAVLRQSTAVLRMAQVREDGPGKGQILASLPPGVWSISWVRDGAYATVGLVHTGHKDEARAFLDFVIGADAGQYASWLGLDDYLVSVVRYRGDGTEESDLASCPGGGDAGPNIELDDWGLFLWAYAEYAKQYRGDAWVEDTLPTVLSGVADPLVALIDPNSGELVADSSIWERHWNECFPNGRKQFTFSDVQAVAGLRAIAEVSGDQKYAVAADRIRAGLLTTSADGGPVVFTKGDSCPLLASAPEETCDGCGPYDASVIDAIDQGVVRPESTVAIGTLQALRDALAMDDGSPGFKRNDDGTGSSNPYPWYDDQEWVVVDLRMATAFAKVGDATGDAPTRQNAQTLLDWVTAEARANHDLLPELLSDGKYTAEDDNDHYRPGVDVGGEFQGAVPMCGFGPGAYVLALEAVHGAPSE